jgi:hypothetical protein
LRAGQESRFSGNEIPYGAHLHFCREAKVPINAIKRSNRERQSVLSQDSSSSNMIGLTAFDVEYGWACLRKIYG